MPTPQARRRRLILGTLTGVGIGLVAVAMITMVIRTWTLTDSIRGTQIDGSPTSKRIIDIANSIKSCTTPGQPCAQRGQRQTAAAVADISVRQIAAVACADQPGTQSVAQIKACVDRTVLVLAAAKTP